MSTNTFFAILHEPSGGFLPQLAKSTNRAATFLEPSTTIGPRLFGKVQYAKQALRWWLQGHAHDEYTYDDMNSDHNVERVIDPIESRKAEEMVIVEVRIQIIRKAS